MKLQNPFRTGLIVTLGVLVALLIGSAVMHLATILTYVLTAIFLALGVDPIIRTLQTRLHFPKWLALVVVVLVVLGVATLLVLLVVPVIIDQTASLVTSITKATKGLSWKDFIAQVQTRVPTGVDVNVQDAIDQVVNYVQKNAAGITSGVVGIALGITSGLAGAAIVAILTLYFAASLETFKGALYRLVPMSRRQKFASIAEQIFQSVGRYVIGQVSLALVNGVLTFVFLSIMTGFGAQLPAVFAFIAFLGSLIPLVGTVSAAVLIVLGQLVLTVGSSTGGPPVWIVVAIYYLIYMQLEAYVLSPNIMNRAVKVPGVVVVIAALTGGTLLGILGALIAIPVAAAILLIIEQVVLPRQAEA